MGSSMIYTSYFIEGCLTLSLRKNILDEQGQGPFVIQGGTIAGSMVIDGQIMEGCLLDF